MENLMRAMRLEKIGKPLILRELPIPHPKSSELLVKVHACGVCRTDLHLLEGDLLSPHLPLTPGHQVVGRVEKKGTDVSKFRLGDRIGIPWLCGTCEECSFCLSGRENLCDHARFTGYSQDGGFADYCLIDENFALPLPQKGDALHLAPLLCAGLIGYRAFRLAGEVQKLGLYGFGSSAHILTQVATALGCDIYAFTRPGDREGQIFARSLGAKWAGGSDELPPDMLDAALIFAPAGSLYPQALQAVRKGGSVISAGIHMSAIPSFPYALLWGERSMSSVANLTRQDGAAFVELMQKIPLKVSVTSFALEEANLALDAIKKGSVQGSAVLQVNAY